MFRPPWDQARPVERLGNSAWMLAAPGSRARRCGAAAFDAIVVGSDPAFSPLMRSPVLRRLFPRAAIVHWCFDLYPEAIAAEGIGPARVDAGAARARSDADRVPARATRSSTSVRACASAWPNTAAPARQETLVPWALAETDRPIAVDADARRALFPRAKLALLYSGTMGRAHDFEALLRLARACRRAHRRTRSRSASRSAATAPTSCAPPIGADDTNVALVAVRRRGDVAARASRPRICTSISLRADWAGVVVPSKFFASLAVGRPVLYAGPADSEIARWIAEHDIGFHLTRRTTSTRSPIGCTPCSTTTPRSRACAKMRSPSTGAEWSKSVTNDRWDAPAARPASQARA